MNKEFGGLECWFYSLASKKCCETELGLWRCLLLLHWTAAIRWAGPKKKKNSPKSLLPNLAT